MLPNIGRDTLYSIVDAIEKPGLKNRAFLFRFLNAPPGAFIILTIMHVTFYMRILYYVS